MVLPDLSSHLPQPSSLILQHLKCISPNLLHMAEDKFLQTIVKVMGERVAGLPWNVRAKSRVLKCPELWKKCK